MKIQVVNPSIELDSAEEMDFLEFPNFGSGGTGAFWSNPGGPSPWEMHPECDELLHIIEGRIEVEILPKDGGESIISVLPAGSFLVVPRGCWHRQHIIERSKEYYVTPGPTLHSHDDDPRAKIEGA
ncbi:MAG: cupin domain-containing protein [Pseudomonadales bacterium]|nr:cupin domain-containing protein [Pseudomonadales bacterium]